MDANQALQDRKQFSRHEKAFKEGMQLYEQGCNAPSDKKTSQWYGWMAALEMANIKRNWLETSRRHFGVN